MNTQTESKSKAGTGLPDHFYRTRITSITASILAFSASTLGPDALRNAKILEIPLATISPKFLALALGFAAVVCFASHILSFLHEAKSHLQEQTRDLSIGLSPSEVEQGFAVTMLKLNNFQADIEQYLSLRNDDSDVVRDPADDMDIARKLVTQFSEGMQFISIAKWAQNFTFIGEIGEVNGRPGRVDDLLKQHIRGEVHRELTEFIGINRDLFSMAMAYKLINKSIPAIITANRSLETSIKKYLKFVRSSKRSRMIEAYVLGVGVTTAVFIVAVVHVIGHIFPPLFLSLPEAVDCFCFKAYT